MYKYDLIGKKKGSILFFNYFSKDILVKIYFSQFYSFINIKALILNYIGKIKRCT